MCGDTAHGGSPRGCRLARRCGEAGGKRREASGAFEAPGQAPPRSGGARRTAGGAGEERGGGGAAGRGAPVPPQSPSGPGRGAPHPAGTGTARSPQAVRAEREENGRAIPGVAVPGPPAQGAVRGTAVRRGSSSPLPEVEPGGAVGQRRHFPQGRRSPTAAIASEAAAAAAAGEGLAWR